MPAVRSNPSSHARLSSSSCIESARTPTPRIPTHPHSSSAIALQRSSFRLVCVCRRRPVRAAASAHAQTLAPTPPRSRHPPPSSAIALRRSSFRRVATCACGRAACICSLASPTALSTSFQGLQIIEPAHAAPSPCHRSPKPRHFSTATRPKKETRRPKRQVAAFDLKKFRLCLPSARFFAHPRRCRPAAAAPSPPPHS